MSPSIFRISKQQKQQKTVLSLVKRGWLRRLLVSVLTKKKFNVTLKRKFLKIIKKAKRRFFYITKKNKIKKPLLRKRLRLNLISRQAVLKKINRKYSFPLLFSDINASFIGSSWSFIKIVNNFFNTSKSDLNSRNFIFQANVLLTRRNDPFQYILRRYTHFQSIITEPVRRKNLQKNYGPKKILKKTSAQRNLHLSTLQNINASLHSNLFQ